MYLVTKLLNNLWVRWNTNHLNISDVEWMSGQVFGSYYCFFWLALNVCFCVIYLFIWGVCVIHFGYLWLWKTWQSLWELTAVTSKEQKDSSLQRAFHLFCHIKYSYVSTEFPQSSDLFIIHLNSPAVTLIYSIEIISSIFIGLKNNIVGILSSYFSVRWFLKSK